MLGYVHKRQLLVSVRKAVSIKKHGPLGDATLTARSSGGSKIRSSSLGWTGSPAKKTGLLCVYPESLRCDETERASLAWLYESQVWLPFPRFPPQEKVAALHQTAEG